MRFETKLDRWLVIVLILSACVTSGLPASLVLKPGPHPTPQIFAGCFIVAVWVIVLARTLPQYYEVRMDGLFIRQGWKKSLLPYASLAEVQSISDSRRAFGLGIPLSPPLII